MKTNYDKRPYVAISSDRAPCLVGWDYIVERIVACRSRGTRSVCIECYPGTFVDEAKDALVSVLPEAAIFLSETCLKGCEEIERMVARELTDDRVFGRISSFERFL